jgi:hypothetical protein
MAMKNTTGGSKKPVKGKATAAKSRGSKTAKQMGDMNARELYNAYRDAKSNKEKNPVGRYAQAPKAATKVTKAEAKKFGGETAIARKVQRAGGSKNLGLDETSKSRRAVRPMPKDAKMIGKKPKVATAKPKSSTTRPVPKNAKMIGKKPVIATRRSQGTKGR